MPFYGKLSCYGHVQQLHCSFFDTLFPIHYFMIPFPTFLCESRLVPLVPL